MNITYRKLSHGEIIEQGDVFKDSRGRMIPYINNIGDAVDSMDYFTSYTQRPAPMTTKTQPVNNEVRRYSAKVDLPSGISEAFKNTSATYICESNNWYVNRDMFRSQGKRINLIALDFNEFQSDDNSGYKWHASWLLDIKPIVPATDWATVAVDTKVLVRDHDHKPWIASHFAGVGLNGVVRTFWNGMTSFTNDRATLASWLQAKLASAED